MIVGRIVGLRDQSGYIGLIVGVPVASVGVAVGLLVDSVGDFVGLVLFVGVCVGALVMLVGAIVGANVVPPGVGPPVGLSVGLVGDSVGVVDGTGVGVTVGEYVGLNEFDGEKVSLFAVGDIDGCAVTTVGVNVGACVGEPVCGGGVDGDLVGPSVRIVGVKVGAIVSLTFVGDADIGWVGVTVGTVDGAFVGNGVGGLVGD
jgi:hypothetical protein